MVDIFELYKKVTFTIQDNKLINNAIENGTIDTSDIKENFMTFVYQNLGNRYELDDIWDYTDENYSNGCTHIENYNNLLTHLKNK
jgi:hypothetical protein